MSLVRRNVIVSAAVLLGVVVGCSSHVNRGADLYANGRYVEAAEVFDRTESRLPEAEAPERARYAMYRGLTMLRLGDLHRAHRWLKYAYQVQRARPRALQPRQRAELDHAWRELGRRMRALPPPQAGPDTAVAASQPPPAVRPPQPSPNPSPTHQRSLAPQ